MNELVIEITQLNACHLTTWRQIFLHKPHHEGQGRGSIVVEDDAGSFEAAFPVACQP
jgi:hypothetical protein